MRRLRGAAALAQSARLAGERRFAEAEGQLKLAEENFNFALRLARAVTHVREELQSLLGLAELAWRSRSLDAARALLHDVTELAAYGPDALSYADACILSAQIERGEGNLSQAAAAAAEAYRLSWCDGPPFAYHWGLERARDLLKELGAEEPPMPPFDESRHEPMPEVWFDPPDEPGAWDEREAEDEG